MRDGALVTPRTEGILDGITRAVLLEEAARGGIAVEERDVVPTELRDADEAFVSSSVRGIVPIASVDGHAVGSGGRGPITHRLQRLYAERIERECGAG